MMDTIQASVQLKYKGSYDCGVCGAGPAGIGAAIQAGRLGLKTALVEQYGTPGGALTVGGDPAIALFFAHKKQVIAGVGWELCLRLAEKGWAKIPDFQADLPHSQLGVLVNPVMAAHMIDNMLLEAGVAIFYHHRLSYVFTESGRIRSIAVATKNGLELIEGRIFIDCTGDGDLAAWAGAPYEVSEPGSQELMPGTLRLYYNKSDPAAAELDRAAYLAANYRPDGPTTDSVYHTFFNSADSESHACGDIAARRAAVNAQRYLQENGLATDLQLIGAAPTVWPRESRRIVGYTTVTADDYTGGRIFPDAVCYSFYPLDQHYVDGIRMTFLAEGIVPTLPYSALVPRQVDNLLVAGRCISGSRLAQSAFRVKASCLAMGQAAGAAAWLAVRGQQAAREVDVQALQELLRQNGAILPEPAALAAAQEDRNARPAR